MFLKVAGGSTGTPPPLAIIRSGQGDGAQAVVHLETMRSKIRQLAAAAAIALAFGAPGAVAQPMWTLDAGDGLFLHQVGGRASVREPSGQVVELALPPGTSLRRLETLNGGWIVAGEIDAPGVTDLFLLRSDAGALVPFPAPPNDADHPLRAGPMPLVENGRLAGLAWLAGSGVRETAVYASQWSGLDWSQPELVSPMGPGTQIAIDGAVLADGSWLLVWSAYDGKDDEILWSRRVGGRWTEPAVLHEPNETPDITPAILATGRGALAAWNWFDGKAYRVRLAAFEDGSWRELDLAASPRGVSPGLTSQDDGALLLYRTAIPPTWTLRQLDERGTTLSTAVVEQETPVRPGLVPLDGPTAWLEWSGERATSPLRIEVEWQVEP